MTGPAFEPPPPRPTDTSSSDASSVVLLIIQVLLGIFLVFSLLVVPLVGALAGSTETVDAATGETVQLAAAGLFISTLIFQIIQASYPLISSWRRGRTIKGDWSFSAKWPVDIGYAFALAIACLVGAQVVTIGIARLVGLDNSDDAANTDILSDNEGSPWLVGIILLVVIGAPLAEELLFRGYLLHSLKRFIGGAAAAVLSSVLFAIPHWQPGATWQETVVLLTALGVVGLVLAIGTVATGRLGPAIVAHALFNGVGTLSTLI